MPLVFQKEPPDYRYMIFVNESGGRYMVVLKSGVCTMEECRSYVSAYPADMITPAEQHKIPRKKMHFQHKVTTNVDCYNPQRPGQSMPDWLVYLAEHFGLLRFIDAYTFHVTKHFMLSNAGICERNSQASSSEDAQGFVCERTFKWTLKRKRKTSAIDFAM